MNESIVRIGVFTALAAATFMPLEHLYGHHGERRHDVLADLGFATVGQALVHVAMAVMVGVFLVSLDGAWLDAPLLAPIENRLARQALEVALGLVVFELVGYAYHRAAHSVPWLWRLHQVHHSSKKMDWLASFRQHPLETVLVTAAQNAPLVVLGLPLASHALVLLLLRLNTVFVHANLRLPHGPWRHLVATPRFHHRHHQRTGRPVNFSAMFPWIDRLMGTYDDASTDDVGLPTPSPRSFVGLMLMPLRTIRSARTSCRP